MKIEVEAEELLTLNSFEDWVNRIPRHLPEKIYSINEFIFIDKFGNFLELGKDFMVADEKKCFPVKVYRKSLTRNHN